MIPHHSPRSELLAIQKKLYRRNKEIIESSIFVKEEHFERYERRYRRAVSYYERISDHEEMVEAILKSNIIYVGDYHTLNQSQLSFLRILRTVVKRDPQFAIGLELLHSRHQRWLDEYTAGKISEEVFLKKVRLKEHWVFDLWENFKPLFDFSCFHGIRLFAIDHAPVGSSLALRDSATGELLASIREKHPELRLFVFIGDLHIAPSHLPHETAKALRQRKVKAEELILYQNSVQLYWKLAEEGLEQQAEVVRIDDRSFCRMHTPPIISQQSYLNWLEHEEGEIDFADAKHSFIELVDRIAGFLNLNIAREDIDSAEVFTAGDLSFLDRLRESNDFSAQEIRAIKRQILSSESYYIPKARFVYLASLSLNHAAEEAAHFIKHVASGPEQPRTIADALYANILHEALGFWGSKVINHKRKCHHEKDLRERLGYFETIRVPEDRRLEQEVAFTVLDILGFEKRQQQIPNFELFRQRADLFIGVTHALGYMLGEHLYYGLLDDVVSKEEMKLLFTDPWLGEGKPYDIYAALQRKLKRVKIPKRM